MKSTFKNKISRAVAQTKFFGQKNSPEILLILGIVGVVASEIGIGIAATKVAPIKKRAEEKLELIEAIVEQDDQPDFNEAKELTRVYAQTGVEYVKVFGPFVLTTVASLAAIIKSHNIMKDRNIALAAAYTILDKSFKEYRNRVVAKYGKEEEGLIRHNITSRTETVLDENGQPVDVVTYEEGELPGDNMFGQFFQEGCTGWTRNPLFNMDSLLARQRFWQTMLDVNGIVTVNDIAKDLGYPQTKAGQFWGWKKEKNGTEPTTVLDFGIYDEGCVMNRDFVRGDSPNCYLSFAGATYIFNEFKGVTPRVVKKEEIIDAVN